VKTLVKMAWQTVEMLTSSKRSKKKEVKSNPGECWTAVLVVKSDVASGLNLDSRAIKYWWWVAQI